MAEELASEAEIEEDERAMLERADRGHGDPHGKNRGTRSTTKRGSTSRGQDPGPTGTVDALPSRMKALGYLNARYPNAVRWSWIALVLLLAACNNGSNSGGGGGGPGY